MEIEPGLTKEETIQKKLKEIEKYENIKEYKEWCDEQNIIQKSEPKRLEKVYIGHGKTKAHFYRSFDGSNYTQADFEYTLECERKETEAKAREARIQAEKEKIEVEKQRLRNNPGCLESVLNWITCSD
ncbi:hypothetical protein HERIO_1496 [Hepatospora eriocheir]|nr:hypothetical protein HERIO_1496 [Hepatospora eriocheir]